MTENDNKELSSEHVLELLTTLRNKVAIQELQKLDLEVLLSLSDKKLSAYVDKYGPLED